MSIKHNKMAREILDAFSEAGDVGLTLKEVSEKVDEKGCGHDCENWIRTFVEAGILEIYGKRGRANLYRLTEKGRKALA